MANRNFIIGTADATVYHLTADETKLDKLFVEPRDAICAISCHPYQPLIAIGSFCGMIKVWNYEKKMYLFSRVFEKGLGVQSLTYNPEGISILSYRPVLGSKSKQTQMAVALAVTALASLP